jgi:hypothetical protein
VRPVSVTVKPVVDEGFANAHCDTGALSTNSWDRDTRKVGFHSYNPNFTGVCVPTGSTYREVPSCPYCPTVTTSTNLQNGNG